MVTVSAPSSVSSCRTTRVGAVGERRAGEDPGALAGPIERVGKRPPGAARPRGAAPAALPSRRGRRRRGPRSRPWRSWSRRECRAGSRRPRRARCRARRRAGRGARAGAGRRRGSGARPRRRRAARSLVERQRALQRQGGEQLEPHGVLEAEHRAAASKSRSSVTMATHWRGVRAGRIVERRGERPRGGRPRSWGSARRLKPSARTMSAPGMYCAREGNRVVARRRRARTARGGRAPRAAPARRGPRGSAASCRVPGRSTSAGWWPCLMVMTRRPRRASSLASATVSVVFPAFFRPMMEMMRVAATARPRARGRPRC